MLMPVQVGQYFPELQDPDMESALALVHSRFSTNTFPSWERAHPYRYIAHNG
jgi:glutamate synthase (ferredoxin)